MAHMSGVADGGFGQSIPVTAFLVRLPRMRLARVFQMVLFLVAAAGCPTNTGPTVPLTRVSADDHPFFPIAASLDGGHSIGRGSPLDGPVTCESCHTSPTAGFTEYSCTQCHTHAENINLMVHQGVEDAGVVVAGVRSIPTPACLSCHPTGEWNERFTHTGISPADQTCAICHAEVTAFAALPKEGFVHRDTAGADCGACHVVTSWTEARGAPDGVFDPELNLNVDTLVPTFSGATITSVRPVVEVLQLPMKHSSRTLDAGYVTQCVNCHASELEDGGLAVAGFYPALLHSSLANSKLPQPATCADCHERRDPASGESGTRPTGFVGPLATRPARTPASGEMRHDAFTWPVDAGSLIVTADCSTCHLAPGVNEATWKTGRTDAGLLFHASLTAAGLPQPTSCLDCHANTRPTTLLTSMNATVPAGLSFDHQSVELMGDCAGCHASTSVWSGAKFHPVGATTPSTCIPCHSQERPISTTSWMQPNFRNKPFDYVTNDAGVTHGAGQDCVICHAGPGSGMWGTNQNWQRGHFPHGATSIAAQGCLTCHTSQRPDLLPGTTPAAMATLLGFDHRANGTGECGACHQATVVANRYNDFFNPATGMLPGGDWRDGAQYPGDFLITAPGQFVSLTTYRLQRTTPTAPVTGITTQSVTLPNAMKHASAVIPAQVHPGTAAMPVNTTCWHCHTNTAGTVTAYSNGVFHRALTTYSMNPGGAVTPLPQPMSNCRDCHAQMLPPDLVQRSANPLFSMDHHGRFTATVNIGGAMVSSVDQLDCSACHRTTGTAWTDGRFHSNIGTATPADCTQCHYPLMVSTQADVTTMTRFAMRHRSIQVSTQTCTTCHSMAFSKATMMPTAAALWSPGQYHANAMPQARACIDCHAVTEPTMATQGATTYVFGNGGGSTTNGNQWMNHTASSVVGRDCSTCHTIDAQPNAMWNKATRFHTFVPTVTQCSVCHGTANGRGTVFGTNNNLPNAATNTATLTTFSGAPTVKAQMNHADLNASGRDCNFCHTQQGTSTMPAVMGKEWAQAHFHVRFTAATPLVMNGTTARCSNCHINEKPGTTYTTFNHSAISGAQTSADCGTCHSYPGLMTSPQPNWKGAAAMPAIISVGGFTIPVPPATAAGTIQAGIANLPHPTVATGVACTACHAQANGGRRATGYPHTSTLIANNCNACHESGSDLVGTAWNGATTSSAGAGDTRPFTLTSVVPTFKGNTRSCAYPKHFYPIDCKQCHRLPAGNAPVTTGAAYTTAWKFQHTESKMTRPGTCNTCHAGTCNLPD